MTDTTAAPKLVYSGVMPRFGAYVIDNIVLGIFNAVLTHVLTATAMGGPLSFVSALLVPGLYSVTFESSTKQATPGKMAMEIRVTDTNGARISPLRALGRWFVYFLPYLPMTLLMMGKGVQTAMQGLHEFQKNPPSDPNAMMDYMKSEQFAGVMGPVFAAGGVGFLLAIVLLWLPMLFTKQKTGLHDMLSGSRVLKKPDNAAAATVAKDVKWE